MNPNPPLWILIGMCLLIGLVGGFAAGYYRQEQKIRELQGLVDDFKKYIPSSSELRMLAGTVERIEGNLLIFNADVSFSPLEKLPVTRRVIIGNSTLLVQWAPKDPTVFLREITSFLKTAQIAEGDVSPPPPTSCEAQKISFDAIKPGNFILVEGTEDIKKRERFEAARIILASPVPSIVTALLPCVPR